MRNLKSFLFAASSLLALGGCTQTVKEAVDKILPVDAEFLKPTIDPNSVPDAKPVSEAASRYGNAESYEHEGQRYFLLPSAKGYRDRGLAVWYPTERHGTETANKEIYDQYQMTAAHKTLPIPSYVRVTNLANQKSVVVRVNDRGPWGKDQIIELSYIAAAKLDMLASKPGSVEVLALAGPNMSAAATRHPGQLHSTPAIRSQALPHREIKGQAITPKTPRPDQHSSTQATKQTPSASTAPHRASRPAPRPLSNQQTPQSDQPRPGYYVQVGAFSKRENAARLKARLARAETGTLWVYPGPSQHGTLYRVQIGPFASLTAAKRTQAVVRELGIHSPKLVEH